MEGFGRKGRCGRVERRTSEEMWRKNRVKERRVKERRRVDERKVKRGKIEGGGSMGWDVEEKEAAGDR